MDHILREGVASDHDDEGNVVEVPMCLVKWTGYSYYSSTWETEDQFVNKGKVIDEWRGRQMKLLRGGTDDFDYEEWVEEMAQLQARQVRRHARRNKKRRALGLPEKVYKDDDDADDEGEASDDSDDQVLSRGYRPERPKDAEAACEDKDPVISAKRRKVAAEGKSHPSRGRLLWTIRMTLKTSETSSGGVLELPNDP